MDSETASRRSKLGLAGLASLCCVGPGTAAVTGGLTVGGLGGGLAPVAVTALVLAVGAIVVRRRTGCSTCESGES
ncbi:hypothetical protein ACFO5R_05390 [Halosolutus amylolyticus]|uniref:Uncharacterized protein n=1 Tax=Halosolutus amylolyticus TaxID=2932267 RepID=A0ABD5PLS4_9EURY|nr:hypothetical protein [Halosolutus amylolyticus]